MIKYTLVCDSAHSFEGWFRNSDDFDAQCARKLVVCPICGETSVQKGLMAPAVSTARKREALVGAAQAEMQSVAAAAANKADAPTAAASTEMRPSALLPQDVQQKEILEALRLVRARIVESSENVGQNFAAEARKIHYGEAEERSIYGETTPKDVEALLDEGIQVFALPELPDDKN
ncbi:MAG: DUF1178 family protein [Rhodobacteraceae bacterium]|nr:DUF1178 family protein [Paracoccaceae bacterium]